MEKNCKTCYYRFMPISEKPCDSCMISKCSENVVGTVYTNWKSNDKK